MQAVAYDNPIPGFDTYNTINLRLWKAAPSREFDLVSFNQGDYVAAVSDRQRAETITSVLYPSDSNEMGKELRLKQQYFFVSATLQDIVRRFKKRLARGGRWQEFAEKNAIQLNDTHPSIGVCAPPRTGQAAPSAPSQHVTPFMICIHWRVSRAALHPAASFASSAPPPPGYTASPLARPLLHGSHKFFSFFSWSSVFLSSPISS